MGRGRRRGPGGEWLPGVLVGIALTVLCILWLRGRVGPERPEAGSEEQRGVGVEITLRFRVLLPEWD